MTEEQEAEVQRLIKDIDVTELMGMLMKHGNRYSRRILKFFRWYCKYMPVCLMCFHAYGIWDFSRHPREMFIPYDENMPCYILPWCWTWSTLTTITWWRNGSQMTARSRWWTRWWTLPWTGWGMMITLMGSARLGGTSITNVYFVENSIIPKIYKRKLSEEENAGFIRGLCSLFRMKLRNLSLIIGNDGLNLHRFHNAILR